MLNAAGLRDQRLKLYSRENTGSDGFQRDAFVYSTTCWGRIDERGAEVRSAQQRLQTRVDAIADFTDDVGVVPVDGLVVDSDTSTAWWIRGSYSLRQLRRVIVALERVALEQFKTFSLHDSATTVDGTHIVDPAS